VSLWQKDLLMIAISDVKNFFNVPEGTSHIFNLTGSSVALFLSLKDEPFISVEQTEAYAAGLYEDMRFFRSFFQVTGRKVHFLPEPNGPEASGRRAEVVYEFREGDSIVTSLSGLNAPVWPPEDVKKDSLLLAAGEESERDLVERRLKSLGYHSVSIVMEKGEYSAKGWLMDVFPSTTEYPVRVEFFGDEIEQIKYFDIDSQRSINKVEAIVILPVSSPSAGEGITSVSRERVIFVDYHSPAVNPVDSESLPDSGPDHCHIISSDAAGKKGEELRHGDGRALFLSRFDIQGEGWSAGLLSLRGLGIFPDERKSLGDIAHALARLSRDNHVIIVASSEGQAGRVREILFDEGVIAPVLMTRELVGYEGRLAITRGVLSAGLFIPGLLILTEREIFGERPHYRPLKKSRIAHLLTSMDDIAPGDLVVHGDHGIGRFVCIQKEGTGEHESDLIVLEYSGGDRLYIPLYNIDRIKKYSAEEGVAPALDRLGGKTWQKRRERVRKAVRDMAERLLRLYAEREVSHSYSFSADTELHREFYDFFPYEETPDQIRAIEDISRDMESERPMDRLLCGDVGYGKTEVAMRAAFKAVYDGKQVAVLVPTTILCEQHYLTFRARFSAFPMRIDYFSRFKSKREQEVTAKALAKGETDIVIGTHSLLRKGISFSDLGLLIIDEEHRFGVAQKERIKEIKKGVDVLSMTATPIPRTLHMALSGIRGMSIIETPPEERLAVRSIVALFDEGLIKEAVERELQRNGQVLFVHNTVYDIEKVADMLGRLLPGARFGVAHGQMAEKRLEDVMLRFIRGEIDVLVSTTIIGSGIDIPTANTIIIDRADRIGLSDLYQLRGRVGRSNVKAYAYFLVPGMDIITGEARKRLRALREMSYLGAGFRLAMRDLEMRGAGNLLGPQQAGHIHAVGFDMYKEMLENAVAELKGMEVKEELEPSISLRVAALIPEWYIEDMTLRLSIYRRIAGAKSVEDVEDIGGEMRDRFGSLPEEVRNLLEIMRLKVAARRLLITKISETDGKVKVAFADETPVKTESIFGLRETFQGIRFAKDGFELDVKGLSGEDVRKTIHRALLNLNA
jgi:transcription-repair coupling factor (superfamily II helicase)